MKPYRVLVTGWRAWPIDDRRAIWRELDHLWTRLPGVEMADEIPPASVVIVHGKCPYGGVDLYAEQWAQNHGQLWEPHEAKWKQFGKAAGNIRNSEMVNLGADLCLGWPGPGSVGTIDCLKKAAAAGIETSARWWYPGVTGSPYFPAKP